LAFIPKTSHFEESWVYIVLIRILMLNNLKTELKTKDEFQRARINSLLHEVYSLRKEVQSSLKDYKDFYNFNPSALLTIDSNYYIRELNFQAALLLGIDRKFLLNQLFLKYITTTSTSILKNNIQTLLLRKLKQTCELELVQKKGGRKYVRIECTLIGNTNSIRIYLSDASNMHTLINRNDELEKSSKLLKQFVYGTNDAIASLDNEYNFKSITPAFSDAFSKIISSKITPGSNLIKVLNDFPDLKLKIINASKQSLEERKALLIIESTIRKNEVYYCYKLAIHAIYNEHNKYEFIFRIINITDAILHERIQQQSEIAISSRASTMGEMISALAHEVSQPLTAINAYSRSCLFLIKNKLSCTSLDRSLLEPLEKIAVQAELAGEIINNMKDFRNERSISVQETDINLLIKDTIALLHYELLDFKLKINLNLRENLPKIMTNKIHIMQVILNLARNSIEALQSSEEAEPELTIETEQSDQKILIHVRDNGPGIPNEYKNKILTTYFTTKHKGTGIGLGICRTLIEEHGGQLTVQQQEKQGAWFIFTLPIYPK
jgi:two-component system sensor kinase FixL